MNGGRGDFGHPESGRIGARPGRNEKEFDSPAAGLEFQIRFRVLAFRNVAHWVEQVTMDHSVAGSNPAVTHPPERRIGFETSVSRQSGSGFADKEKSLVPVVDRRSATPAEFGFA